MNGISKILRYEIKSNYKARLLSIPVAAVMSIIIALIPQANPSLATIDAALIIAAAILSVTVTLSVLLMPASKMEKILPNASKLTISRKEISLALILMDIFAIVIGSLLLYLFAGLIVSKAGYNMDLGPIDALKNFFIYKNSYVEILFSLMGLVALGIFASFISMKISFNPEAGSILAIIFLTVFGITDYISELNYSHIIITILFLLVLALRHYVITKTDLEFK